MTEKDKEINELRAEIKAQRQRIGQLERRIHDLQAQDYNAYKDGYIAGSLDALKQARQWIDGAERDARQK